MHPAPMVVGYFSLEVKFLGGSRVSDAQKSVAFAWLWECADALWSRYHPTNFQHSNQIQTMAVETLHLELYICPA